MPHQLGQAPTINREEKEMADDYTLSAVSAARKYSCEVLLEKTSYEVANDKSFPTDAKLITYMMNGKTYMDLTRSAKDVRCLLYTSPSPRDGLLSRMPSSA